MVYCQLDLNDTVAMIFFFESQKFSFKKMRMNMSAKMAPILSRPQGITVKCDILSMLTKPCAKSSVQ